MAIPNHYHTLRRHPKQKNIYLCTDPYCHFKNDRDSILGKIFKCFLCGRNYILTRDGLRLAVPHCKNCTKVKEGNGDISTEIMTSKYQPDSPDDVDQAFMDIITSLDTEINPGKDI